MINFELEKAVQEACRTGIRQGWINAAHDCAEGGLAVALAESCIGNGFGADINIQITTEQRLDEVLFGESGSQIIVAVNPEQKSDWEAYLTEKLGDLWTKLGFVTQQGSSLDIVTNENLTLINVKIGNIKKIWQESIEKRLKLS